MCPVMIDCSSRSAMTRSFSLFPSLSNTVSDSSLSSSLPNNSLCCLDFDDDDDYDDNNNDSDNGIIIVRTPPSVTKLNSRKYNFHVEPRPVYNGPVLSGQFSDSPFFAHTNTVFVTCIRRPPLLSGRRHPVAVPCLSLSVIFTIYHHYKEILNMYKTTVSCMTLGSFVSLSPDLLHGTQCYLYYTVKLQVGTELCL